MKKYMLKRDLPTKSKGTEFYLDQQGLHISNPEVGDCDPFYDTLVLNIKPDILTDWFEEIPERPKTVWDLKEGDECWYISAMGIIHEVTFGDYSSKDCRATGSLFLTLEDADKERSRREAKVILERDTKGFKPSKENNWRYWSVYYDPNLHKGLDFVSNFGFDRTLTFATEEDAQASIKNHEKEWLCYLNVEE